MTNDFKIRIATPEDAEALLKIYKPYVENTAITFEYEVPSIDEFSKRIENTLNRYPYIVGVTGNEIIGYAYASAFHPRVAYDRSAETSIYLKKDCRGNGIGKKLYLLMEAILKKQNILNLNACIAYTQKEDSHLTNASVSFHQHLGYKLVGHFTKCGYKFNTWYDMVWMEKLIGLHQTEAKPVIPFYQIKDEFDLT